VNFRVSVVSTSGRRRRTPARASPNALRPNAGALDPGLGRDRRAAGPKPGADDRTVRAGRRVYLWTYGSSVLAHLAFFDLPGSAVLGGLLMGLLALPFAARLWRSRPAARPRRPQHSLSDQR
jgi:hypothetical protein